MKLLSFVLIFLQLYCIKKYRKVKFSRTETGAETSKKQSLLRFCHLICICLSALLLFAQNVPQEQASSIPAITSLIQILSPFPDEILQTPG